MLTAVAALPLHLKAIAQMDTNILIGSGGCKGSFKEDNKLIICLSQGLQTLGAIFLKCQKDLGGELSKKRKTRKTVKRSHRRLQFTSGFVSHSANEELKEKSLPFHAAENTDTKSYVSIPNKPSVLPEETKRVHGSSPC